MSMPRGSVSHRGSCHGPFRINIIESIATTEHRHMEIESLAGFLVKLIYADHKSDPLDLP
jgi:hypothetical protein